MDNYKNLASAALLFLETANKCLTDIQYDQLQHTICQTLGNEVVEAILIQKISKGANQITIKRIYDSSQGLKFIRIIRGLLHLTLRDAKQYWDMACEEKPVSIKIDPNLTKEARSQQLLALSHVCFFVME